MSKRLLVVLAAVAPLLVFGACAGDDTIVDGGTDGGKDATTDAKKDATVDGGADAPNDATLDAAKDATTDATADAPGETTTDATADAAEDAATDSATDSAADSAADAATDAETDASMDASDGGGSMWHTITCDGTISSGEYGDASNQTTSGSQTWYVTWNATNLYVGLTSANVNEGTVIYVGFSGNGVQNGQTYDGTNGTLPFLADGVVYAKHTYLEVRVANGDAGTWSGPMGGINLCDDGNATREEVIPWTALGATSIPSSFRFFAYATSSGGFIYGQIPTTNPGGQADAGQNFAHDFLVGSTANGGGSFPFDVTE